MRRILVFFFTAACAAGLTGCSGGPTLPDFLLGVWLPEGGEGMALRFEVNGGRAEVYYASVDSSGAIRSGWLGPLRLRSGGENAWKFTYGPPGFIRPTAARLTQNLRYIMPSGGDIRVKSFELLESGHVARISRSGRGLAVEGLWKKVRVETWKANGEPDRWAATDLKVDYRKQAA